MFHRRLLFLIIGIGALRLSHARLAEPDIEGPHKLIMHPIPHAVKNDDYVLVDDALTDDDHHDVNDPCDVIVDDLPTDCTCTSERAYQLLVNCLHVFNESYLDDTVGMILEIDPCNPVAAKMTVNVTELNHNINLPVETVVAGEQINYPIPGMNVYIPHLMNLGVVVAVLIEGNLDSLTMKVGLDACAGIGSHQICAESIPFLNGVLPWWILDGTYAFGDVCEGAEAYYDSPLFPDGLSSM